MKKIHSALIFLVVLLVANVSSAQNLRLPDVITTMLRAAQIPEDAIATKIVRLSDGASVLAHNTETGMQPASTMKLVTTLVGLERLGPTYRGHTDLLTLGEIRNNVLQGDLVLRGVADSDLDWQSFQTMLQTLRHLGIQEIRGNLVIDRSFFQPSRPDIGAPQFDDEPEFRYNVIPDALLLNMNLGEFEIKSDANAVTIRMTPALDGVSVVANMNLIDADCKKWEDGWKSPIVNRRADGIVQIQLNGTFPKNCTADTELNVLDRAVFADRLFRTLWRQLGGTFGGKVSESRVALTGTRLLATHRSRPLAEVIRDINKSSDNTLARLLYLTLGTLQPNENSQTTAARADAEIRAWFSRHGIRADTLVLDNGSGLSRAERISASEMAALLMAGAGVGHSNWAPEFAASLPIAALDGTMRRRLRDSPAAQRARLKTGTLKNVVAVAGYVPDGTNEVCVVVAFINHPLAVSTVAQPILDALVDWVSKSKTESAWALPASAYAGG